MELFRPGEYNSSFIDRIERCIYKLRLKDDVTIFEVEDILEHLFWETTSSKLTIENKEIKNNG